MTEVAQPGSRRLIWLAAGLSAFASLAFALAAPEHVDDAWQYRAFFVAVAAAEMALAVVLIVTPWRAGRRSEDDPRWWRAMLVAGAIVAGAAAAVYLATLGISPSHVDHGPGEGGAVAAGPGVLDLLPRIAELALVAALIGLYILTSRKDARFRA